MVIHDSKIASPTYHWHNIMNLRTNLSLKSFSLLSGSFIGLAVCSSASIAAPTSALNPCPKIYYEEPHNTLRIVPQGCPPNAISRQLQEQSPIASSPNPELPVQPPLPESQQIVLATIVPQAGAVTVQLTNSTNTQIVFQSLGNTAQRTLVGKESVVLKALPLPTTITFLRPDGGLIKATPVASAEPGVLILTLDEATGLSDSQSTVRIQSSGKVSAY